MLRVGLTGSIGVGKSFVCGVLVQLGCKVLDADQTAREVVEPGTAGLAAVVESFGDQVLRHDGTLNREKLGTLVFANSEKRLLLNSILHPFIIARQDDQLAKWEREVPDSIGVVDAALMIESGGYKRFDRLIVVHCEPAEQLRRVMNRSHLTREQAEQRINAQLSQEEKMKLADYLIDTTGDFAATRDRTIEVFEKLQTDARMRARAGQPC